MGCPGVTILNGITVEYSDEATYIGALTWNLLNGLTDIDPVGTGKADDIEINDLDSASAYKLFCAGMVDGGELSMTHKYEKARFATLLGIFTDTRGWRVTFPDGSTIEFDGYLNESDPTGDAGNPILIESVVKVSGAPLFTPAA